MFEGDKVKAFGGRRCLMDDDHATGFYPRPRLAAHHFTTDQRRA
jgi:hypothetical protein